MVVGNHLIFPHFQLQAETTTVFTLIFLLALGINALAIGTLPRWRRALFKVLISNWRLTCECLALLVVFLQLALVLTTHPAIGFDVGAIHNALTQPQSRDLQVYFSLNANNLPLLLLQVGLAQLAGTHTWLWFDVVTLIAVDVAAGLIVATAATLQRSMVPYISYLMLLTLAVFPMILVPYTDTWVLPWIALYLWAYAHLTRTAAHWWQRLGWGLLWSFGVAGAYILKPSAIIPVIAMALMVVLTPWPRGLTAKLTQGVALLLLIGTTGTLILGAKQSLYHQTFIKVDWSREIPAVHFMSMGVSGTGGYNPHDALMMAKLPTKQARTEYSLKLWRQRLQRLGVGGYLAFLVAKQQRNTQDGTFSWLVEGHFLSGRAASQRHPRGFGAWLYPYGTHLADFQFLAQLVWVIVCFGPIWVGWRPAQSRYQVFQLAMLGGLAFLLLFEGGRSRYLIQFLPVWLLLASAGWQNFSQQWLRKRGKYDAHATAKAT